MANRRGTGPRAMLGRYIFLIISRKAPRTTAAIEYEWTALQDCDTAGCCNNGFRNLAHSQSSEAQNQKWDLGIWAGGATGEETTNSFSEAQILTAGLYIGRDITGEIGQGWYRGQFEYGFDVAPLFVQLKPQRSYGTAFDPLIFRWHPSLWSSTMAPFLELGGGAVRTTANFPAGDTSSFNFIARGGGGVLVPTKPHQAVEVACRWWHISNANLGRRNPEFNGILVSLGYHWMK